MRETIKTIIRRITWAYHGTALARRWQDASPPALPETRDARSPLEKFFDDRTEGLGIWKWRHYFDIYNKHLSGMKECQGLVVVDIGVYSGGSLDMWRQYFGPSARLYGVDIEPACRAYEKPGTKIIIGDQADPAFWRRILNDGTLPAPDVVIDDGGHTPEQQRVTLTALLPRMAPGGVYICEDIHGLQNPFSLFVHGFSDSLNDFSKLVCDNGNPERRAVVEPNEVQATIRSVHFYPYMAVIEKTRFRVGEFAAPKHGTQWQPFLT